MRIASILHAQSYIAGTFLEISLVSVSTSIYLFDYISLFLMLFLKEQECNFSLIVQAYNSPSNKVHIFKLMCV